MRCFRGLLGIDLSLTQISSLKEKVCRTISQHYKDLLMRCFRGLLGIDLSLTQISSLKEKVCRTISQHYKDLLMRCFRGLLGIHLSLTQISSLKEKVCRTISLQGPLDHSEEEKTEIIWTCDTNQRTIKDHPPGDSSREEEMRQTDEQVGRQYYRMDREELFRDPSPCTRPQKMEDIGGFFINAEPLRHPGLRVFYYYYYYYYYYCCLY